MVFETELLDVDGDIVQIDYLLLQNILEEHDHQSDHSDLVHFVLGGGRRAI
jgi:hypothetical protein